MVRVVLLYVAVCKPGDVSCIAVITSVVGVHVLLFATR